MSSTPTVAPDKIRAGTTSKWTLDPGDDYRPAAGWTLSYRFNNGTALTTVAGTDNTDGTFLVTVSATVSGAMAAGDWPYSAIVTKGSDVYEVDTGTLTVEASFGSASEGRSFAKEMLDLVEEGIRLKLQNSPTVASYAINGRSLQNWTYDQLHAERNRWRREYEAERQADKISKGQGTGSRIRVEFR
jgi:hypothetical protein